MYRAAASKTIEQYKTQCSDLLTRNTQLAQTSASEIAALREEFAKEKEELIKDSSQKISDLGGKVAELTSVNEALQKEKSDSAALLAKAEAEKAALQAEVDSSKKGKDEPRKKKVKALRKKVEDLEKELNDLGVEKRKSDEMTKVGFQDGFCLVRHQVLLRFPDLDLSFLEALNIPEGPRWSWSKLEHLNLPQTLPAPVVVEKDAGASGSRDAENP